MTKKPLIGITFDAQGPGGYSHYPWYVLRENYCSSISDAGGIPFPLTHDLTLVEDYLSLIDGLVITGGGHDVDPLLYGAQEIHPSVNLKPKRTTFEMAITQKAFQKDIPVFGICGGHQLINVALGGTLIQDIPHELPHAIEHKQTAPHHEPTHEVKIIKNTMLHKLLNVDKLAVNSFHHQAVKDAAPGVIINALTPDGLVEGFEAPAYRFCLGLQWHPEFTITSQERAVFDAFVEATRG
ncbi:MAG: gamma-glutamyl-gamma-aminobutyrate hydrolase family protein [Alphaproteobacteria bacterium]|nr:gamma-glutamyl-gamma-aminobutyrate hydrolase family protein [Alphaproteobacteria bacterium]